MFLKRSIMELSTFFTGLLIPSFFGEAALDLDFKKGKTKEKNTSGTEEWSEENRRGGEEEEEDGSGFRFDLILVDSEIVMARHSLSQEKIYF